MTKLIIWLVCCLVFLLPMTLVQAAQDGVPDCGTGTVWDSSMPAVARGFVQVSLANLRQQPNTAALVTGQLAQQTPVVAWGRTAASDWLQLLPNSPLAPATWIAASNVNIVCGSIATLPATDGVVQPAVVNPNVQAVNPATQISLAPEQAIAAYYDGINNRQYANTWAQLTTTFKNRFNCPAIYNVAGEYACNVPTVNDYDYTGYLNWWNSVRLAEVSDMQRVCADSGFAVVRVDLAYHLFTGRLITQPDRYIKLMADPNTQTWRYHDAGYQPRTCTAALP